jgi:hypothetical protein
LAALTSCRLCLSSAVVAIVRRLLTVKISPETRLILHQEFLRAIPLGFVLLVAWVILMLQERVPASGWSFLLLVPGLTTLVFLAVVIVRVRTGWRLGAPGPAAMRRWERNLNVFLLWVLFSLLAIAYIGQNPYLGLTIAIMGGIIMGVVAFRNFEATMREEREARQEAETHDQQRAEAPQEPSSPEAEEGGDDS